MNEDSLEAPIFKKSSKPKRASKLRLAIQEDQDDISTAQEVFRPKKNLTAHLSTSRVVPAPVERKSIYSHEYLQQLRDTTPTHRRHDSDAADDALDYDSLPGERPIRDEVEAREMPKVIDSEVVIPDESTIKHVKEQRDIRRRAGENYIPLSDALSVADRQPGDRAGRIQTEDAVDDMGDGTEGLKGFESDSMPLGTRAEAVMDQARRAEMADLIQQRQEDLDEPYAQDDPESFESPLSSDSDDEWERTQVRKSAGQRARNDTTDDKPRATMPEMRPIMTVPQMQQKIKQHLEAARQSIDAKRAAIAELEREQIQIAEQEETIKANMQRSNLAYETARLKIGGLESIARLQD